jgi:DNA helicase-2/ATP-dependent DNA helicase PcrA
VAAVDRKLGRCAGCPSTMDEQLFEALREWRAGRAKELSQPAYCVFTDATLTAIAEQRPTTSPRWFRIPGIGQAKLDKYGEDVLGLVGAQGPRRENCLHRARQGLYLPRTGDHPRVLRPKEWTT